MARIPSMVDVLRLSRVEAGPFQVIFDAYGQVLDQVSARSSEAATAMAEFANTLRSVANTYDEEEAAGVHRMSNIY